MTRILVLATALALLPSYALANKPQSAWRTDEPVAAVKIPPACTPINPCAVPPPAISMLENLQLSTAKQRNASQAW